VLYEEFGDDLFTDFAKLAALEPAPGRLGATSDEWRGKRTTKELWGAGAKKGLPEKKKKKLLDARTWERDGRLVEVATLLRARSATRLFEDHNVFRDRVDAALKAAGVKLPPPTSSRSSRP
jgi:type I restriction enzyme M protein